MGKRGAPSPNGNAGGSRRREKRHRRRGATSRASPRHIAAADRQRRALELRAKGKTYTEIAGALGFASASGSHAAVVAGLQATLQEPAEGVRVLELERLDRYLEKLERRVGRGEVRAIEAALKVATRRARLLGLDAPQKSESTVRNQGPDWDNMDEEQLKAVLKQSWREMPEETRHIIREANAAAEAEEALGRENPPVRSEATTALDAATCRGAH
jgi:hypothetical protein